MKIFLYDIDSNAEIEQRISILGCEPWSELSTAEVIVYEKDIDQFIADKTEGISADHIISLDRFLNDSDPFVELYKEDLEEFSKIFLEESIKEVTLSVGAAVEKVFDAESFSGLDRYLKLISIELIQNSLNYGKINKVSKPVEYRIARGKENYLIMVKDYYGDFERETFLNSLARAYRDKTHENKEFGAGLGLSMILSASDQLCITRKKGEFTKIRSIINKYKRLKEYKNKKTSITFLEES